MEKVRTHLLRIEQNFYFVQLYISWQTVLLSVFSQVYHACQEYTNSSKISKPTVRYNARLPVQFTRYLIICALWNVRFVKAAGAVQFLPACKIHCLVYDCGN